MSIPVVTSIPTPGLPVAPCDCGVTFGWNVYFLAMTVIVGYMAATRKDAAVLETAIVVLGGVWAMLQFK